MILITYIRVLTRKRLNGPYVLMLAKQRSNSPKRPQRCALAIEPTIDCSTFAPTSLTSAFALFFQARDKRLRCRCSRCSRRSRLRRRRIYARAPCCYPAKRRHVKWIEKISLKRGCRVVSGTTATKESSERTHEPFHTCCTASIDDVARGCRMTSPRRGSALVLIPRGRPGVALDKSPRSRPTATPRPRRDAAAAAAKRCAEVDDGGPT